MLSGIFHSFDGKSPFVNNIDMAVNTIPSNT